MILTSSMNGALIVGTIVINYNRYKLMHFGYNNVNYAFKLNDFVL